MRSDRTMPSRPPEFPRKRQRRKWGEPCPAPPPQPPPAPLPPWVPPKVDFHLLPRETQEFLSRMIGPLYEQLLGEARSPLARTTAMTLVQMAWLEAVTQMQLGPKCFEVCRDPDRRSQALEALTTRFLRLAGAQTRASSHFMRTQQFSKAGELADSEVQEGTGGPGGTETIANLEAADEAAAPAAEPAGDATLEEKS